MATTFDLQKVKEDLAPQTQGYDTLKLAAQQLQVVDDDSYKRCSELYNEAATREKNILKYFKENLKDPINKIRNAILDMEKTMSGPWATIKAMVGKKGDDFLVARREAERAAKAEMDRQAKRLQQQMEEESKLLKAMGLSDEARAKEQEMDLVGQVASIPSGTPKVEGARVTEGLEAQVTDTLAFLKGIVRGEIPLVHEYRGQQRPIVVIDQPVLNAVLDRIQHGMESWPGVTVRETIKMGAHRLG